MKKGFPFEGKHGTRGKRAICRRNEVELSPKVTDEVDT